MTTRAEDSKRVRNEKQMLVLAHVSDVFSAGRGPAFNAQGARAAIRSRCFTIGSRSDKITLNLEADDDRTAGEWLEALKDVLMARGTPGSLGVERLKRGNLFTGYFVDPEDGLVYHARRILVWFDDVLVSPSSSSSRSTVRGALYWQDVDAFGACTDAVSNISMARADDSATGVSDEKALASPTHCPLASAPCPEHASQLVTRYCYDEDRLMCDQCECNQSHKVSTLLEANHAAMVELHLKLNTCAATVKAADDELAKLGVWDKKVETLLHDMILMLQMELPAQRLATRNQLGPAYARANGVKETALQAAAGLREAAVRADSVSLLGKSAKWRALIAPNAAHESDLLDNKTETLTDLRRQVVDRVTRAWVEKVNEKEQ